MATLIVLLLNTLVPLYVVVNVRSGIVKIAAGLLAANNMVAFVFWLAVLNNPSLMNWFILFLQRHNNPYLY